MKTRTLLIILFISMIMIIPNHSNRLLAQEKFYNYYDKGITYMEKGDWQRAIIELKSAVSLEFEDAKKKRTYGTRFIQYFPHREMGIAYYNLGEYDQAMGELQLSIAYKKSDRAEDYINRMSYNGSQIAVKEPDYQKQEEVMEDIAVIPEKPETVVEEPPVKSWPDEKMVESYKVPVGALTYDPNKVTQVGSRLAIAVMPFEANENALNLKESVTQKMITQLVNLRRFRVIERGAIEQVMQEQAFTLSGMVSEDTAIEVGKIVGADVIILGSITVEIGFGKVNARGIDIETGETIVAKEATSGNTSIDNIEKLVEGVAIMIYNDLPLVEGYVVSLEDDLLYLDIGSEVGVRKGTKCVAFQEGEVIKHPVSKKVLGRKVKKLGELIVVQVQEKMATARVVSQESSIGVGDKVVVK